MKPTVAVRPIEFRAGASRRDNERRAVAGILDGIFGKGGWTLSHHSSGAPYLPECPDLTVSISHSRTMAAVALDTLPVGVDIEQPRPQLERVASRFLSPRERQIATGIDKGLLRAWTAKEAVYKAALIPGLDFALDIVLDDTFTTALCKGRYKFTLETNENLPDNNFLTLAKLDCSYLPPSANDSGTSRQT